VYARDTNAILYYLKDDVPAPRIAADLCSDTPIYISAITELELFAFASLSAQEESLIEDLLATVSIMARWWCSVNRQSIVNVNRL
jgi:predicted nucleic acid-binding protein